MAETRWMIYGAYGYSGELIAREAVRQGHHPLLAGRNPEKLARLGTELSLPVLHLDLNDRDRLAAKLANIDVVIHCAGPFSATAEPMMQACLLAKTHYLDITGEIDVFERAHQLHDQAVEAGIVLCPGVGFDVIPTDCVAAALAAALPDANLLRLGFDSRSSFSPGTAKTSVEGLADGGKIRRDGNIERVPLAYKVVKIDFGDGPKLATTIPWGDVSTAYHTTGIPNIEVYIPSSPRMIRQMKIMRLFRPIIGWGFVQNYLKRKIAKKVKGPSESRRKKTPTYVWGQAENEAGDIRIARMRTANGYEVTKHGALAVALHLLETQPEQGGHYTPARLMGAHFASTLPDSTDIEFFKPKPESAS